MTTTEFSTEVRGIRIAGRQGIGDGRAPLVLLHGSGASSAVFSNQFDGVLGDLYHLVAIDLPGHGKSGDADDPSAYGVRGMAASVGAVIDRLALERPVVYGWSMGGHIAIELASGRADIAGIAVGGTPPVGPGPLAALHGFHFRRDMLLASKETFSESDAERFMRLCFATAGSPAVLAGIRRADGRARVHFLRSLMRGVGCDQRRQVETSPVPFAMIDGADDPIVRRRYVENLAYANLWGGKCHTVAGAAHAPFLQQPEAFDRILGDFVRDVLERDCTRVRPRLEMYG